LKNATYRREGLDEAGGGSALKKVSFRTENEIDGEKGEGKPGRPQKIGAGFKERFLA